MKRIILVVMSLICLQSHGNGQQTFTFLNQYPLPVSSLGSFTGESQLTKGYHDGAMSMLLIDERFKTLPFVLYHINLETGNHDTIHARITSPGAPSYTGTVWSYTWAANGKVYIISHAPEMLFEFNPYTNTIRELDYPLIRSGSTKHLIYRLSLGRDSALYGGTGAYDHLYTFRYDVNTDSFYTHMHDPIETENSYVDAITGDSAYTYIVTGKENYRLYSYHRRTQTKKLLLQTGSTPISVSAYTDYCLADYTVYNNGVWSERRAYKLVNGDTIRCTSYAACRDSSTQVYYTPVRRDTLNYPECAIDYTLNKVMWKFMDEPGQEHSVTLSPYRSNQAVSMMDFQGDSSIIGVGPKYSFVFRYDLRNNSSTILGPTKGSTYSFFAQASKVYQGSYPSGSITIYDTARLWNQNTISILTPPPAENTESANPRTIGYMRTKLSPVTGPHLLSGLCIVNDTLLGYCGPVDIEGNRVGQGCVIGTTDTAGAIVRFADDPSLEQVGLCTMTQGERYIFVSATAMNTPTAQPYIYVYDPLANSIVKKVIVSSTLRTAGQIAKGRRNQVVGYIANGIGGNQTMVYFLSEVSQEIYKTISFPHNIQYMAPGSDDNIWMLVKNGSSLQLQLVKMDSKSGDYTIVHSFSPAELAEGNFSGFVFNGGDIYFSGAKKIAKIAGITTPVNHTGSLFDRLNKEIDQEICQ